jgi:hypothetical protein
MENQKLPNATAVLILGILSILTCCCYGVVGIILAIVALVLANKDTKIYTENPDLYSNYSNVKIGKILAYIGIVLSLIYLAFVVWLIVTFGYETLQDQEALQEAIRDKFGA